MSRAILLCTLHFKYTESGATKPISVLISFQLMPSLLLPKEWGKRKCDKSTLERNPEIINGSESNKYWLDKVNIYFQRKVGDRIKKSGAFHFLFLRLLAQCALSSLYLVAHKNLCAIQNTEQVEYWIRSRNQKLSELKWTNDDGVAVAK